MPVIKYIWDPESDNILAETDEHGNILVEYTYEPGYHGKLISMRRDGQTSYFHFDGQGNTRALTDPNHNVTDRYTYDAFGNEQ